MKEKLTKERALTLHRWMWNDMREKLGNNPDGPARSVFKQNWLYAHNYENVECHCFLCEYDFQQWKSGTDSCEFCPIDWSPLSVEEGASCGDRYIHSDSDSYENGSIWRSAPIDEILNLPEKEGV